MRAKALAVVLTFTLACGEPATIDDTETGPATTTMESQEVATTVVEFQPAVLGYGYRTDAPLTYQVTLEQDIQLEAEGDQGAFGADQELPLEAALESLATTLLTYTVQPGPEEGTYSIGIAGEFDEVEVTGTVNGKPFDESAGEGGLEQEVTDLPPVDATVVVDEQGNLVSSSGSAGEALLLGNMAGLSGLGNDQLARPLGPAFPSDRELGVGDSWSEERTVEGPDGPIPVRATHTVSGVEQLDGQETLVVESTVETEGFDVDMSDVMREVFEGFAEIGADLEGASPADTSLPPEIEEMLTQIEFLVSVEPSTHTSLTWFDPEAGVVRQAVQSGHVSMTIDFAGPDEETGAVLAFSMQMVVDQTADFLLTGG